MKSGTSLLYRLKGIFIKDMLLASKSFYYTFSYHNIALIFFNQCTIIHVLDMNIHV